MNIFEYTGGYGGGKIKYSKRGKRGSHYSVMDHMH